MHKDLIPLILKYTRVSVQHLTPEIPLRLITPSSDLWRARLEDIPFPNDPFWGFYWPGGQAVTRYILDNAQVVNGRRVLDVGCGGGAGSIAAARAGAARALANDIDECALLVTQINSALNNVSLETSEKNFVSADCDSFDVILIGDMFYDEQFANELFDWLRKLTSKGKTILIGDPGRHGLTDKRRRFMQLLARYKLPQNSCLENIGFQETTVWRLV